MSYYEYHHKSPEILQKAREKYSWLFDMNYSEESREVRYYLLEYLDRKYGYSGILENDENGKPIPIKIQGILLYWSISHSTNYLAFIVSDMPTGIDIAENEERNISLLDTHSISEYDIMAGNNWNNFYILWTAKESIIKATGGGLDDMKNMRLIETNTGYTSLFAFREKTYRIQTLLLDSVIISYTI